MSSNAGRSGAFGFSDSDGLRSPTGTSSVPGYVVDPSTRTARFGGFMSMPGTIGS